MRKRNLQNEEFDRIERKLFDATRMRSEEINQILSSPALFDSIKARIERDSRKQSRRRLSVKWLSFQNRKWQSIAAAGLIIYFLSVVVMIAVNKLNSENAFEQSALPKKELKSVQPENKLLEITIPAGKSADESPTVTKIKNIASEPVKASDQKVFINKTSNPRKPAARKAGNQYNFQSKKIISAGEFYALTVTGNPVEAGEEIKIIRAELSRSSLFALGVNLPIENESEKIKTDLLVGADGVATAIRIVD